MMAHRETTRFYVLAIAVWIASVVVSAVQQPDAKPVAPATSLSEAERLRIDNNRLKAQLTQVMKAVSDLQATLGRCQEQLGPFVADSNGATVKKELDDIRADVEKGHPGMTLGEDGTYKPKPETPPTGGRGGER